MEEIEWQMHLGHGELFLERPQESACLCVRVQRPEQKGLGCVPAAVLCTCLPRTAQLSLLWGIIILNCRSVVAFDRIIAHNASFLELDMWALFLEHDFVW